MDRLTELLDAGPIAVNLGVRDFAKSLRDQGAEVVEVDWRPPSEGDAEMIAILDQIL